MKPRDHHLHSLKTDFTWKDLKVQPETRSQLHEIEAWVKNSKMIANRWNLGNTMKTGFGALFYGPDSTGKTLAASLLGKATGKEVYRIDLSGIVSKYIGETEKNLNSLFERANNEDWILYFDEADALFGKRTDVKDSHDRYANQEVSYLLQRMEEYNGLVILSSNMKETIDPAFVRRLRAVIHFP